MTSMTSMTSQQIAINGNSIKITHEDGNVSTSTFRWPVKKTVAFSEAIVVLTTPPTTAHDNRNVWAINYAGKVLWQIIDREYVYESSPFTGLGREGNNARLYNWDGCDLLVNPLTGEILDVGFSK